MTCIIGFVDNGKVYIGGDSAGVSGYLVQIREDVKVFRNGPFLMGFTTSFRMGQLLHYAFEPPEHPDNYDDMRFMVCKFVPAVKKCLKEGGWLKTKDGQDDAGSFLVGYRGHLYEIDSDLQVGKLHDRIASVGCGSAYALGAMYALGHLDPTDRVKKALEITTHLNAGVRPPFVIEVL